jgi:hypothetical protein
VAGRQERQEGTCVWAVERSGALSVRARHTPPGCRTRVRGGGCVYLVEPGWHRDGRCATRLRCAVRGVGFLRTSYGHHTDIIRTKKADTYGQGSDKEAGIIRTSYGHHTDIIRTSYGQGTGHNRTRSNHPPLPTTCTPRVHCAHLCVLSQTVRVLR